MGIYDEDMLCGKIIVDAHLLPKNQPVVLWKWSIGTTIANAMINCTLFNEK